MRIALALPIALLIGSAIAAPRAPYIRVDATADGTYSVYVNPDSIIEVLAYDTAPLPNSTKLLVFDVVEETKQGAKAPASVVISKQGVSCGKFVLFSIQPSSDGQRYVYTSARFAISATTDRTIADFVCGRVSRSQ